MDPTNEGKFITSGLWKVSRHPNYFGEILIWWGMWMLCVPELKGLQHLSVISPTFVMLLLSFVSGVPLLEKSADKRWGGSPDYESYKKNTAVLIPFIHTRKLEFKSKSH